MYIDQKSAISRRRRQNLSQLQHFGAAIAVEFDRAHDAY
jgi:hypothetical protein